MSRLVLESWFLLLSIDCAMRFGKFRELHRTVQEEPIRPTTCARLIPYEDLCRAMDYACVLYFTRVLCLQRSAATAIVLRRHGWSAEMVIGTQILPFKSHAWCEVNGAVVNDKSYVHDIYEVLERC